MRILFLITQSEIGGAQRFLLEFAPYLASRGHKIAVAAGEGDDELFVKLDSSIKYHAYKVKNLVRALSPARDLLALVSILKIITKEKPSILFLQSTKAGFLGSLAAKIYNLTAKSYKLKAIYRIGGWAFRDPRPWWMNQIVFWMEKISARWKDIIIVNSEYDRQVAIDKKIASAEKIVKIYNGVDTGKLNFLEKEEAREKFSIFNFQFSNNFQTPISKPKILIGAIANLYATKGIEYLIESARQLYLIQNTKYLVQFVVIGEGPERPKLEKLIKEYNLQNNFFLVGRIPNATQYLKAFDIFTLPSVKEGFPWALLEAMAAEVPIIATRVGAVPEILEDDKEGWLVPPRDSDALAQKITRLVNIPAKGARSDSETRREARHRRQNLDDRLTFATNARKKLVQFSLQKMLEETYATLEL